MANGGVVSSGIQGLYQGFIGAVPSSLEIFVNLFLLTIFIFVYAWLIWKFYLFISKKNILEPDLEKYNKFQKPVLAKIFAGLLFFLVYLLVLPFLIFVWFAAFAIFLILLTQNLSIEEILLISTIIVGSIRVAAYYSRDLSKEIAKLLPLTLLVFAITNANFNVPRIIESVGRIPSLISDIGVYFIYLVVIEVVMRFFDMIISVIVSEEDSNKKSKSKEDKKD